MIADKTRSTLDGLLAPLTPRHVQYLQALAAGYSYRDIADELQISVHTVKPTVSEMLRRMDAVSQAQAVAKAIRMGII